MAFRHFLEKAEWRNDAFRHFPQHSATFRLFQDPNTILHDYRNISMSILVQKFHVVKSYSLFSLCFSKDDFQWCE